MFTGIIEEVGTILDRTKTANAARLKIGAKLVVSDVREGDSISVNGICLTVTSHAADYFTADVMHETLCRSAIDAMGNGSRVNLERAVRAGGRFGGHIVTGHIDGVGTIRAVKKDEIATWYSVAASPHLLAGIIEKGSVALDGISLTVANVTERDFSVSVIPHTSVCTALSGKAVGDCLNIETDCIGKYVAKLLLGKAAQGSKETCSKTFLAEHGFL